MRAYALKVYLVDGDWGYIRLDGCGGFELTREESTVLCFKTMDELMDFYEQNVKYGDSNGVAVDTSRTCAVQVEY